MRVLQEIIAAGYSDPQVAQAARQVLEGWYDLLVEFAGEGEAVLGLGDALTTAEVACLIGMAFMGAESMILIGVDQPILSALRGVGAVLKKVEAARGGTSDAR